MRKFLRKIYLFGYRALLGRYPLGTFVRFDHDRREAFGIVVGKWKKPKAPFGYVHDGSLVLLSGSIQEKENWELKIFE